ncbi:hypothetical protein P4B07_29830 (plasmid) [Ensifer adhaerens]|uniref:Transposase n=1 Tax=Ensifer adhaerens TaxID=106592 RepID=A0ABY8HV51_ENSAD|nr:MULTISPECIES: hypothetical protein [Ensifer]WFP95633.1 hypothetical protein P4B07_29830 [Ensifer adhaerens]
MTIDKSTGSKVLFVAIAEKPRQQLDMLLLLVNQRFQLDVAHLIQLVHAAP